MKKLILLSLVLVMAGSAFAFTVNDNPQGGLYPAHLRRTAKVKVVNFEVPAVAAADTVEAAFCRYFRVPFNCKIDSAVITLSTALTAGDTAAAKYWFIRIIGNQSAANGDTIFRDSTSGWTAKVSSSVAAGQIWKIRNGPDSTKQNFDAGKIIRIQMGQVGGTTLYRYFTGSLFLIPSDR